MNNIMDDTVNNKGHNFALLQDFTCRILVIMMLPLLLHAFRYGVLVPVIIM